jgi:gliding motility-associated-like protein
MSFSQKILFFLFCLLLLSGNTFATHNRAGEITYRHISGYTFEFTITTYTFVYSQANRDNLEVSWGDGTFQIVPRNQRIELPNNYYYNTYVAEHTFPGAGTYQILMEDPNRNLGVKNIPNSVNTIFSIQTTMLIGPFVGANSTPILLNPPIDNAALNHIFIHNPAAFDADGDSISYQLTVCTEANGEEISGYTFPPASDSLYVDGYSGDLTWNTPIEKGVYNIAMFIDEWRNGVKIGRLTRDMQIDVYETGNNPPVTEPIPDFCVESGDTVSFLVSSTDIDNDPITQIMTGAPAFDDNTTFDLIEAGAGFSTSRFTWPTNCSHARQQPYTVVLKAEDVVTDISLVDIKSFFIRVLPSAPENLRVDPGTDLITLNWNVSDCGQPIGYNIYRRISPYNFVPDSCENGVPEYTGYELIDKVQGIGNNSYTDNNGGRGLVPGFDYCYLVTAFYIDGVESFASEEACATLIPGVPAMLEVSVLSDDANTGEISIKWAVPHDFDTVDDGPYRYNVYRIAPGESDYSLIQTIPTVDLNDTVYLDQDINTLEFPYHYSIRLWYQDDNMEWVLHNGYESATSTYLGLTGRDNNITIDILKRSPWLNYAFDIFRKPETGVAFDSLTTVNTPVYIDTGLANNIPYTYRAISKGTRPVHNLDYATLNISHINSTSAFDSIPPCTPLPSVISVCDSALNILRWVHSKTLCGDNDVVRYEIHYSPDNNSQPYLIDTVPASDSVYIHNLDLESLAAIYGVVAVDSFNNKSGIELIAIDSCQLYDLGNVFSPNGDTKNDIYIAYNPGGFVKEVKMSIFNRYGTLVYETHDPDINWDGRHKDSGKIVSTGVYYYICEYSEKRLTGNQYKTLKGFIHVYSDNETSPPVE